MTEETMETPQMNWNGTLESLKAMAFGEHAFERFSTKERETLNAAINVYENAYAIEACNLDLALENEKLLEQIEKLKGKPRKVIYEGDGYADGEMVYDYAYCPNCNHETEEDSENWGSSFCPECGQALDWGEMKTL